MIRILVVEDTDSPEDCKRAMEEADLFIHLNSLSWDEPELVHVQHVHVKESFSMRGDHAQAITQSILIGMDELSGE